MGTSSAMGLGRHSKDRSLADQLDGGLGRACRYRVLDYCKMRICTVIHSLGEELVSLTPPPFCREQATEHAAL